MIRNRICIKSIVISSKLTILSISLSYHSLTERISVSLHWSLSTPTEKNQKTSGFLVLQGVQKETSGTKSFKQFFLKSSCILVFYKAHFFKGSKTYNGSKNALHNELHSQNGLKLRSNFSKNNFERLIPCLTCYYK